MRIICRQVFPNGVDNPDLKVHYEWAGPADIYWNRADFTQAEVMMQKDPRITPLDAYLIGEFGNDIEIQQIASTKEFDQGFIAGREPKEEKSAEVYTSNVYALEFSRRFSDGAYDEEADEETLPAAVIANSFEDAIEKVDGFDIQFWKLESVTLKFTNVLL